MIIHPTLGVTFQGNTLLFQIKLPVYVGATAIEAVVGQAISFTVRFANSGTTSRYTSETLPDGLTIHAVSGLISGTPTQSNVTVTSLITCTNGRGSKTAMLVWVISSEVALIPIITSGLTVNAQETVAFLNNVGAPGYTIAGDYTTAGYAPVVYSATGLPTGLSVNASTGAITGTPAAETAGTVNVTIGISNVNSITPTTAPLVMTIASAPPALPGVVSPLSASRQANTAITPIQLSAANVDPVARPLTDYFYWQGSTPNGLDLSLGGLITGTTTGAYNYSFTVYAGNPAGESTNTMALTVMAAPQPPVITSVDSTTVAEDIALAWQIEATNSPTSYAAVITTTLAAISTIGLFINATTGLITGTIADPGTYSLNLSATNADGTGPQTFVITVSDVITKPAVTLPTSMAWTVDVYAEHQLVATNTPTSYRVAGTAYSILGLTLNTATGLFYGTPNQAYSGSFTFFATNGDGEGNGTAIPSVIVDADPWNEKTASDFTLGTVGADGLTMVLTGSYFSQPTQSIDPTNTGTATVDFTVPTTANYYLSCSVDCAGGGANSFFVEFAGAPTTSNIWHVYPTTGAETRTVNWTETPGFETGTKNPKVWPLTSGTRRLYIYGREAAAKFYSLTLTAEVQPTRVRISSRDGQVGVAFAAQLEADGYPTQWSQSGKPTWMTFNTTTGLCGGTPDAVGTPSFTVQCQNGTGGNTAAVTITLDILAGAVPVGTTGPQQTTEGTLFTFQISATNGPHTGYNATALGGGALPAGFSVNPVTGLVTVQGSVGDAVYNLTVHATNASGTSSENITVTVNPAVLGGAWYIDSSVAVSGNGQSWASAWKTISNIFGVQPGDTVYFSGGVAGKTYTATNWTPTRGTNGSPVTYRVGQDSGHTGMVTFEPQQIGGQLSFLRGNCSDITFNGEVSGAIKMTLSSSYWDTVYSTEFSGGSPVMARFKLLWVKFYSNIWIYGSFIEIGYCDGRANLQLNNGADTFISHIGEYGGGTATDNSIHHCYLQTRRNKVQGFGQDTMQWVGNVSIYNNTFVSVYDPQYYVGGGPTKGNQHNDGVQSASSNVWIYDNTFIDIMGYPIYNEMHYGSAGWKIWNNVIWCRDTDLDWNANFAVSIGREGNPTYPETQNISNMVIANNTIIGTTGTGGSRCRGIGIGNSGGTHVFGSGVYLVNNLIYNCDTLIFLTGTSGSPTANTNNVGPGTSGVTFVDAAGGNFRLAAGATAAIDAGIAPSYLTAVFTTDKDGTARGAAPWDIGAYKY